MIRCSGKENVEAVNKGGEQLAGDLESGYQDGGEVARSHEIEVGALSDGDNIGGESAEEGPVWKRQTLQLHGICCTPFLWIFNVCQAAESARILKRESCHAVEGKMTPT